jgi:hypothetical protein
MKASLNGGTMKFQGYKVQRAGLIAFSEKVKLAMTNNRRLNSIGRPVYMMSNQGTKTRYRSKIVEQDGNLFKWENKLVALLHLCFLTMTSNPLFLRNNSPEGTASIPPMGLQFIDGGLEMMIEPIVNARGNGVTCVGVLSRWEEFWTAKGFKVEKEPFLGNQEIGGLVATPRARGCHYGKILKVLIYPKFKK